MDIHLAHAERQNTKMPPKGDINAALEALKLADSIDYTATAKKFGVNRSTLSKRHRGVQGSCEAKAEKSRNLNNTQEDKLIAYIGKLYSKGLPPTHAIVRNFAEEIAQKPTGSSWVSRFLKRHDDQLLTHWTASVDSKRFRANSAFRYSLYFERMRRKIDEYAIDGRHIYNMGEKGFIVGILSKQRRIFTQEQSSLGKLRGFVQSGNREWVTIIAAICADGTALSPSLIYKLTSRQLQDTWLQDFDLENHSVFFSASLNG